MILCIFDTETTGLIDNHMVKLISQPEVIEFACVHVDWDDLYNIKDSYEVMLKPSAPLSDKIKQITHLSDEDLAGRPTFRSQAAAIAGYLVNADVICGHNLSYDMEIIDLEFERFGQTILWPTTRVCTVEQSIHISGNRINLGDLYRQLTGKEHTDAHRAMPDVLATLACLREMRNKGWL